MSNETNTICNYEDHELKLDPRIRTMMNSNKQNQTEYCTREGCTYEKSIPYHDPDCEVLGCEFCTSILKKKIFQSTEKYCESCDMKGHTINTHKALKVGTTEKDNLDSCFYCGDFVKEFESKFHEGRQETLVVCSNCNETFEHDTDPILNPNLQISNTNSNEEITDDLIKCPYCGYIHDSEATYPFDDGDENRMDCESCEKEFSVVVHRSVTVTTKTLGDKN